MVAENMMTENMEIRDMLIEDINYLAEVFEQFYPIGALASGGVTRLGYSAEEDLMHSTFVSLAERLGLETFIDQAGNTFASCGKKDEPYFLIGSHLDSVVDGGRYDGVAGIMAGLLVMRWAKQEGLDIPIRTAAFRCEESSNFGTYAIGSELITGGSPGLVTSFTGKDGRKLADIFAERGYSLRPEKITGIRQYLEVHIEQARVLEQNGERVAAVSTVAGPRRFKLHIQGMAEHSGATPMNIRNDALCAAAEIILEVERAGIAGAPQHSVATVGVINNQPNVLNVIPGTVELLIDTRGINVSSIDSMELHINQACKEICARRGATFILERIGETLPIDMDKTMRQKLLKVMQNLQFPHRQMSSGAGHDAVKFAGICETAMVFIPCRAGISHNKKEFATLESICDGARVVYEYLQKEWSASW